MGTNYYYFKETCKYCGNGEEIHIGKSSFGWKFHFHYEAFENPENWKEELRGKQIYDEYGKNREYNDFIEFVESKQNTVEPCLDQYFQLGVNYFVINNYEFYSGEFS